jgi:hypothetical protein
VRRTSVFHSLKRAGCPFRHHVARRSAFPHTGAHCSLEGELGVCLALLPRIVGKLQCRLHRMREAVAVVAESVSATEAAPKSHLLVAPSLECDGALQQADRVVELVPSNRTFRGALQPPDCFEA